LIALGLQHVDRSGLGLGVGWFLHILLLLLLVLLLLLLLAGLMMVSIGFLIGNFSPCR
jgi:hypothetical protein